MRSPTSLAHKLITVGLAATLLTLLLAPQLSADDDALPANAVTTAASTIEVIGPQEEAVLLEAPLRLATVTDLLLAVTLECSLVTDVTTVGNDEAEAIATITVWIEIDGVAVPVADGDDGEVVFCNRAYRRVTTLFDDEDATIETYFSTRSTHGFNWIAFNPGNGIHDITVNARLETAEVGDANAEAVIGSRTLAVEPVFLFTG